jgi:hypothetical protein
MSGQETISNRTGAFAPIPLYGQSATHAKLNWIFKIKRSR